MSTVEAVEADLAKMPPDVGNSGLAQGLIPLARGIDDPNASLAMKSMAQKELRETMDRLRELAPPVRKEDSVDQLARRRAARRAKAAGK